MQGEQRPRKSTIPPWVWPWAIAGAILAGTFAVVVLLGVQPREWAAEVTYIAAHLVAAEVIIAGHRRK